MTDPKPDDRDQTSGPEPDESPKERVDRELIELLNGLRVILPGVQVLLAFLLTVPFSSGFGKATSTDRILYFVTVLLTVAATGALTMPAAYHRIRFRQGDKERMLHISNVFAIVGLVLLTLRDGERGLPHHERALRDRCRGSGRSGLPGCLGFSWFAVPCSGAGRHRLRCVPCGGTVCAAVRTSGRRPSLLGAGEVGLNLLVDRRLGERFRRVRRLFPGSGDSKPRMTRPVCRRADRR